MVELLGPGCAQMELQLLLLSIDCSRHLNEYRLQGCREEFAEDTALQVAVDRSHQWIAASFKFIEAMAGAPSFANRGKTLAPAKTCKSF